MTVSGVVCPRPLRLFGLVSGYWAGWSPVIFGGSGTPASVNRRVCAEYERALDLAKQQARTPTPGRRSLPLADITGGADWKDTPLLKSRLAGGFCLRAPAQGACTYANICEHCPSFHTEPSSLPILAAQRVDAEALAVDAEKRGWIAEAERHHRLVGQLDTLISEAQAG